MAAKYLKEEHGTLIFATGFTNKKLLEVLRIHARSGLCLSIAAFCP